jgi:hypothetical protein
VPSIVFFGSGFILAENAVVSALSSSCAENHILS